VADAVARMAAAGNDAVQRGAGFGAGRDGAWAYFDTTAALGLMVEAVEPPSSMLAAEFTWPRTA
jgi:hypothetical protein